MNKGLVIGGALALAVAYLAATPYIAVYQIKGAIERRDGPGLAEYVDFPAVRQSVKDQFDAAALDQVGDTDTDEEAGLAAVGAALAGVMVDKVVEAMVTPAGLNKLMEQATNKGVIGAPLRDASTSYTGWSRFVVTTAGAQGHQAQFVLRRQGLSSWKITDVIIPKNILKDKEDDASAAAATAADGVIEPHAAAQAIQPPPAQQMPAFQPLKNPSGMITQGRCHMGACSWTRWLTARQESTPGDPVVTANVQWGTSDHAEVEDYPSKPDGVDIAWSDTTTVSVFCSHTRPSSTDSDDVISMSPDTGVFGYQEAAAMNYFMACHSDPSANGVAASIKKYGYNVASE